MILLHRSLLVTFIVIVGTVTADYNPCNDAAKKAVLEKYTVKEDPANYISGMFSDVYVKSYHNADKCSYIEYKPNQKDGAILQKEGTIDNENVESHSHDENLMKTDQKGVYKLTGIYDDTKDAYTATWYILFADEHVLSYYVCDTENDDWNAAIQVKSSSKAQLLEKGSAVLTSLNAAKAAWDKLITEHGEIDDALIKYDFKNLCP